MKDVCKNVKCGHGSCTVKSTAPFYECKCKPPYRPPNCKKGRFILLLGTFIELFLVHLIEVDLFSASACRPNPCQNGGSCVKGRNRSSFQCSCPHGYTGKFCEVGKCAFLTIPLSFRTKQSTLQKGKHLFWFVFFPAPDDCYVEDGGSYRGTVSVTVEGEECLDWNSYFLLRSGNDPFLEYPGFDGIGPHNYCR